MYEAFYGFKARPFQVVPDPSFLYWSDSHQLAFTMLRYGLMTSAPISVVTGEVGAGKTTLLRKLLDEFGDEIAVGLLSNIQEGKGELLEWALMAFEQPYDGDHVTRFRRFESFVIDRYASGQRVLLIVDEAQNLGVSQLEELRMLSNINQERDQLLQIMLLGQPELRDLLNQPELRQFAQRITSDYHLQTLSAKEVGEYIHTRLSIAGGADDIFEPETIDVIAQASRGVPRLINVICDLCLVYGFAAGQRTVGLDLLRELLSNTERNGIFNQFGQTKAQPTLVTGGGGPQAARAGGS